MPAQVFQRKAFLFVVVSGIVILALFAVSVIESSIQEYWLHQFALKLIDGKLTNADGSEPSMMSSTALSLAVNIIHILKVILWMALVISIVRFLAFLVFETALKRAAQSEVSSLLRTVLSIVIYIVAFFIIFQTQYPSVQLAALFTGSTILAIVVGLALQDTLGNLFAGIALQADQLFQTGDVVTLADGRGGVVESISWRGVRIRTFQNKILVLSNAVLGKETMEVAPKENLNARLVFFNTIYSNSPSKTAHVVREAVRQVENVSQKYRPIVRIRNLGDNGIDWEVKFWCEDYSKFNDTDALVRQRIWYVFSREKIDFAYPTRTVHMEERPVERTFEEYVISTVERLSRIEIFAPLAENELEKIAQTSVTRVFAPAEAIVRRGQEGDSMFVITSGSVKVQIPENDYLKTINKLSKNDFFGEMSLLTGQPRTADVIAEEETEVLQIKKTALKPIFESNPELMKAISEIIDERRKLLVSTEIPENEA
ncbi:MAG: cyclic nucleotide-binding domain-containing protein, partial [Blastocatellia bacterium]